MLDFLSKITVDDPATMKKPGGTGNRKAWNPIAEVLALRVWKDGSIFPSEALVKWFNLDYRDKGAVNQGNGLDVFSSEQFPIFKTPKTLILINVVDKEKPKVDLFGTAGYDEKGVPTTSVLDQGAPTFGKKTLLPLIKSVYGVEPNEAGFIDLILLGSDGPDATTSFLLPDGKTLCHVPKTVSRGDKQGEGSYIRRENPRLYVLYPADLMKEGE